MNEGERLVGVVGDRPAELDAAATALDVRACEGDADSVLAADPNLVVAVGDDDLLAVARSSPSTPILPVDVSRGFYSVPTSSLRDGIERVLRGNAERRSLPVLRVEHDGATVARAVADVSLLTAEVAHISEYAVATGGRHVDQFRADGVVVATPAGSPGYARRIGSPVVAPGTGVGTVAPIAPFATDPDHWVLPLDDLRMTVERDETSVTLLADDREVATVERGEPVGISPDGTAEIAVVPESDAHF